MKLSDYISEALPITKESFLKLLYEKKHSPEFDTFCKRMTEQGGYGALR